MSHIVKNLNSSLTFTQGVLAQTRDRVVIDDDESISFLYGANMIPQDSKPEQLKGSIVEAITDVYVIVYKA